MSIISVLQMAIGKIRKQFIEGENLMFRSKLQVISVREALINNELVKVLKWLRQNPRNGNKMTGPFHRMRIGPNGQKNQMTLDKWLDR